MSEEEDVFKKAARLLKEADAIILTNGAGLGVDSGLGTFRGRHQQDGGWGPFARDEETPYSMSKPHRFDEDPHLAWGYNFSRHLDFEVAQPHAGYHIMLDMCASKPRGFAIFTSNIDSHWSRAIETHVPTGAKPQAMVEYHGSMRWMQCHRNCARKCWETRETVSLIQYTIDATTGKADGYPQCPGCHGVARFNVCLIADTHFNENRRKAQEEQWQAYMRSLRDTPCKVVVLEIGAGSGIPTVRRMSGDLTTKLGAKLVRINLDEPELDLNVDRGYISNDADHCSIGGIGALDALTRIKALVSKCFLRYGLP